MSIWDRLAPLPEVEVPAGLTTRRASAVREAIREAIAEREGNPAQSDRYRWEWYDEQKLYCNRLWNRINPEHTRPEHQRNQWATAEENPVKDLVPIDEAPTGWTLPRPDHKLSAEEHAVRLRHHMHYFRYPVAVLTVLPFILATVAVFASSDAWTSLTWIYSVATLAGWGFYFGLRLILTGYEKFGRR